MNFISYSSSLLLPLVMLLVLLLLILPPHLVLAEGGAQQQCTENGSGNGNQCQSPETVDLPCLDASPKCPTWAGAGECTANPSYMLKNCRISCGLCDAADVGIEFKDEECHDLHPWCDSWAKGGECILNPNYVLHACPKSCVICINVTAMRVDEGLDETAIQQRIRFAKESRGKQQNIGGTPLEVEKIKPILIQMEYYAKNNVTTMPLKQRKSCINENADCAVWAAMQNECEKNTVLMMKTCPLTCRFCGDTLDQFTKCHSIRSEDAKPLLTPGQVHSTYTRLVDSNTMTLASTTLPVKDQDDPWVLRMENFLSTDQATALVEYMKHHQEWTPVIPPIGIRRQGMVATCRGGSRPEDDCMTNALYKSLVYNISTLLAAPLSHMEHPDFVHYTYMQSYGVHHDYAAHDSYLPAGPRVWSWYISLSTSANAGGAMGFPDLDWLSIPPKVGQLLLWPNVLSSDPMQKANAMVSEELPVLVNETDGNYGMHGWVRMYDYDVAEGLGCV